MTKYIDADLMLQEEMEAFILAQAKITDAATRMVNDVVHRKIQMLLTDTPAADVTPIIHAKWDVNGRCTNCGGHAPFYAMASTYHKSPYCFECGAKMDGGT